MRLLRMATLTIVEPGASQFSTWSMSSRRRPQPTFWSRLCDPCRSQSTYSDIKRALPPHTAWDTDGAVKAHWTECLLPTVLQYLRTNRKQICGCQTWTGSIDCWMVGERPLYSRPCLVVTCHVEKSRKRLIKMLEKDSTISHSGFEVLGRCGNLRFKTDRDDGKGSRGSFDWPSTVEPAGLGLACGSTVTNYPPGSGIQTLRATLGGLLLLGSHYVALTVAHVLVQNGAAEAYPHDCTEDDIVIDSPGQRRSRRNSSGSRSRSRDRDEFRKETREEIREEKPYPRRGKTRMPTRLVHTKVLYDLGYPYYEEASVNKSMNIND